MAAVPHLGAVTLTRARLGGHVRSSATFRTRVGGDSMVQRKIFPAHAGYSVAVASERMRDGSWSAVATIMHSTGTGERVIDLPVTEQRFETEEEAERSAVRMG